MSPRSRVPRASWESDEAKREPPRICPVSGKRMYATEREASSTASHRLADKESGPAQLATYKCDYCNSWHLTSKKP